MNSTSKSELRTKLRGIRIGIPDNDRDLYNQAIRDKLLSLPVIEQAETIFCFLSMEDEVDTHVLIDDLSLQGKTIVVPKIFPDKKMEVIALGAGKDLETGEMGILVPRSSRSFNSHIDICLAPGLGFSPEGHRLGFGRGYYDKWLSGHDVAYKIGIAYDCQVLDKIPVDERDVPMDMIVTEKNVYVINEK